MYKQDEKINAYWNPNIVNKRNKLQSTKKLRDFHGQIKYELLKYLAVKPGRVFSRESLLHSVWEYDYYGGTRTVDVHIRRLRSKINNSKYTM